jgi:hypothetical protein
MDSDEDEKRGAAPEEDSDEEKENPLSNILLFSENLNKNTSVHSSDFHYFTLF